MSQPIGLALFGFDSRKESFPNYLPTNHPVQCDKDEEERTIFLQTSKYLLGVNPHNVEKNHQKRHSKICLRR